MEVVYGSLIAVSISGLLNVSNLDSVEKGNVGSPYSGVEIKVVNDSRDPVEQGVNGKILCRSHFMFQGYYRRDDWTAEVISPDGWLDTGGVGLVTASCELIIRERARDIISRGTRKIIPSDIEHIILQMSGVDQVAIIAVPDKRLFEEICVCYNAKSGHSVTPHDVEEYCKQNFVVVGSYDGFGDMPKYFLQFQSFPLLTTGKSDSIKSA